MLTHQDFDEKSAPNRAVVPERNSSLTEQVPVSGRTGRHVVILCHPDPNSFNHAIANTYRDAVREAGQRCVIRDLYAMGFDPLLKADERPTIAEPRISADVSVELNLITGSDVFVLIYPIWFGSPPAMMKGYIERVLGSGVSPEAMQRQTPTALLGNKRLFSVTTSGTTDVWLNEQGQELGLRSVLDAYLVNAFGMHSQEHLRFDHITPKLSPNSAGQHFYELTKRANRICAQVAYGDEAVRQDPDLIRQTWG